MTPAVSFVVPCYKLAHLLRQCVESILSQTYGDLEVLIMDDCSPDDTAEVARSFQDPRVQHIRNDPNLGHLRNYNKGIGLTRGRYVWLISADDYLRRPYLLQRYVSLLDKHPNVGYAFCPGVGVKDGEETEVLPYSVYGNHDRVIPGHAFVHDLLRGNLVLAASGMARRKCYDQISMFPLNMPWAGDWYLWLVFALHSDVGYFAEPMVCYREHELSMTSALIQERSEKCAAEEVLLRWAVRRKAIEAGFHAVSKEVLGAVADHYARGTVAGWYRTSGSFMTLDQFEESLRQNVEAEPEREWARARVYAGMADQYYWRGDLGMAQKFYAAGLRKDPLMAKALAKWCFLALGKPGAYLRRAIRDFRPGKVPASAPFLDAKPVTPGEGRQLPRGAVK